MSTHRGSSMRHGTSSGSSSASLPYNPLEYRNWIAFLIDEKNPDKAAVTRRMYCNPFQGKTKQGAPILNHFTIEYELVSKGRKSLSQPEICVVLDNGIIGMYRDSEIIHRGRWNDESGEIDFSNGDRWRVDHSTPNPAPSPGPVPGPAPYPPTLPQGQSQAQVQAQAQPYPDPQLAPSQPAQVQPGPAPVPVPVKPTPAPMPPAPVIAECPACPIPTPCPEPLPRPTCPDCPKKIICPVMKPCIPPKNTAKTWMLLSLLLFLALLGMIGWVLSQRAKVTGVKMVTAKGEDGIGTGGTSTGTGTGDMTKQGKVVGVVPSDTGNSTSYGSSASYGPSTSVSRKCKPVQDSEPFYRPI
jgi:hypothetical protein